MSITPNEAALEEFYDQISEELYPEHKDRAITEFTTDRLQSFYLENQKVMRPAVDAIQEGRKLQKGQHYSAALVFFVSAIEILLKTTLLKPVIYGLIHNEALAEIIVKSFLNQSGFKRYEKLMSKIFQELAVTWYRSPGELVAFARLDQDKRNKIIHQGLKYGPAEAELSRLVAVAVFESIVKPVLLSMELTVEEHGKIIAI